MELQARICERCQREFRPPYRVTKAYWEGRRFCSDACRVEGMRGEPRAPRPPVTHEQLEARFWIKVKKGAAAECWPWIGARQATGYGFMFASGSPRRWLLAHRFSYELASGASIPEVIVGSDGVAGKTQVCHTCDNPPCVNPAHLWLGTLRDNQRDKTHKGRNADNRGPRNPRAKLTESDVAEIRALRGEGLTQQAIAGRYGVAQATISKILIGQRWKSTVIVEA